MPHTSDRSGTNSRRHMIWIAIAVAALAFLVYFFFFTATPDRAILTEDELSPAPAAEEPAT
ncbi:hypothetical protein VSX64_13590 [Aurantimonas sp. C2-6-R+9]|uniref:hypothetical protein n=1 Tax=unclassified Aurantimonas TaxID=2638230 RepID=UPI002E19C5ED|nr:MULTISPECIES: hypothetical protein [unclassified Aurantimonas]MEC5291741.1 hypothetical protein [Aurantimonas sp. C2-3-R2]MEC5381902.1 hypothetical protein [Aurantimonas sp. C2-6-R+9]MEC5412805.1 hypothetical protein [Aurantimonas sp. C2-4-R8]